MRLCNTIPVRLLAKNKCKQYNTLNINDFKKKARQINQETYSHTTWSDTTQGHLRMCRVGRNQTIQNSM